MTALPGKVLVCRCEDVTLADVEDAMAQGYADIEEIKRYTGLGTGPCQGRECVVPTCQLLARAREPARAAWQPDAPAAPHPFTVRPPLYPVALGSLAGQPAPGPAPVDPPEDT